MQAESGPPTDRFQPAAAPVAHCMGLSPTCSHQGSPSHAPACTHKSGPQPGCTDPGRAVPGTAAAGQVLLSSPHLQRQFLFLLLLCHSEQGGASDRQILPQRTGPWLQLPATFHPPGTTSSYLQAGRKWPGAGSLHAGAGTTQLKLPPHLPRAVQQGQEWEEEML